jgi:rhodanese-related sulfurtransferase
MNDNIPVDDPWILFNDALRQPGARLVDVRSRREYAAGHAAGAISLPLGTFDRQRIDVVLGNAAGRSAPLAIICESGIRSRQAARKLEQAGLRNLRVVRGGTRAWRADGLPLETPRPGPSIERQVQLFVGLLLMLILAKAALLHPGFLTLLVLLGVVMATTSMRRSPALVRLVRRLPWNRRRLHTHWATDNA